MQMQTDSIPGLVDGVIYQHNERVDELNDRIFSRISADVPLKPLFTPRSVMTRYSLFPVIDRRAAPTIDLRNYLDYSVSDHFSAAQSRAPVDGYFRNVELESGLRNQHYSLSSAPQKCYVPSSNSDLYRVRAVGGSLNEPQPFDNLFREFTFEDSARPNVNTCPANSYFNSTRSQLRGNGVSR